METFHGCTIYGDYLITYDNTRYDKIAFKDALDKDLHYLLKDPEKAERVYASYKEHIRPLLSAEEKVLFEKWLVEYAVVLGNPSARSTELFDEDSVVAFAKNNPDAISRFFNKINEGEVPVTRTPLERRPIRVAIITTSSGGGHLSVAKAMDAWFKTKPGSYCSEIFNTEDQPDVLMAATGTSGGAMYDSVFIRQGDRDKTRKFWNFTNTLQEYIHDTTQLQLKERVRKFQPDIVLSSRHFLYDDVQLSYSLHVPMKFVHCDYEFNYGLRKIAAKVDPHWVKFSLPDAGSHIFTTLSATKPVQHDPGLLELVELAESKATLEEMNARFGCFEVLGYPVRLSFERELDPINLAKIRKREKIAQKRKVVLLMMGAQGGKNLESRMQKIFDGVKQLKYPIHLIAICGRNEEMQQTLRRVVSKNKELIKGKLVVDVRGHIEEKQLAELYNISDLLISKSGGATSGEVDRMAIPLLSTDPLPWEKPNENHLVIRNLATRMPTPETRYAFVNRINKILSSLPPDRTIPLSVDWKEVIDDQIELSLKEAFLTN